MSIYAQIDFSNNIIRIIDAESDSLASKLIISTVPSKIVDITSSTKCDNFYEAGKVYDAENDSVLPAKTYPSWIVADDKISWKAPVPKPNGTSRWNEDTKSWV